MRDVCFALLPEFPLYALVPAIEALRLANQNAGSTLYDWSFASRDGGAVTAGNGMAIKASHAVAPAFDPGFVIVCAGNDPTRDLRRDFMDWLHRRAAFGARLGALDTGVFALAAAGTLTGYRHTLHWEAIPAYLDMYPKADVVEELFVIDRGRWTCAGGTAALDMMLALIDEDHGPQLAQVVANGFVHGRGRSGATPQRASLEAAVSPIWHRVVKLMAANIAYPLAIDELCRQSGSSRRTIERVFQSASGISPAVHYLQMRLERARDLLFYTNDTISHVSEVTGFLSNAHFSRAFRERYGASPRDYRSRSSAEQRHRYHPAGVGISGAPSAQRWPTSTQRP